MYLADSNVFFLSLLVLGANCHSIVDFVHPCHIKDDACLLDSAKTVVPNIVNGNKEIGIAPLDPMKIKHIKANTANISMTYDDLVVIGASQCKILKVVRPDALTVKIELECPITANGKYTMKGNVFSFTVDGDGDFSFDTDKIRLHVVLTMETIVGDDGLEYYKVSKFEYTYDSVGEVHLSFKNLISDDKENAELINKLIKDSPKKLLSIFGKEIITEIIKKFAHEIGHLIAVIPKSEIELA